MGVGVGSVKRGRLLLISSLILLLIIIPASAMWSARLGINVSVTTGSLDPGIHSYKGFKIECHCHRDCSLCKKPKLTPLSPSELYLSSDGTFLILHLTPNSSCHNGTKCCNSPAYVLAGMIVKNYGTIPIKLWGVKVFELSPNNGEWSFKAFYYGPLHHIPPPYWKTLASVAIPPPGSRPPPVTLDPGEAAVILVILKIEKGESYDLAIKPIFTQFNEGI